ncbi:hypothetical protein RN001_001209 [Aquatica leii]|uniref:tRNA-5-taurinomethyluridine 2-sulfurtransferase n=1 Tax=Aquatica leii TaxID=1421715 RepID=A0AAN7SQU0_9COLE|nr:hypothetical protein RN001_001209 [Aquatica leii]
MLKIKKVVVGISGGVDSAVVALMLKNKGYSVQGLFMQNWDITDETGVCKTDEDFKDANIVCDKLQIPLVRVNFVKHYWNEVFSDLLKEYESGNTPNPDVMCNRHVKFDAFYHHAREHYNADAIATGHYARTSFGPYLEQYDSTKNVRLLKAVDVKKDQTLFLCQIKQEALRRTMFPLGEYIKVNVKKIALENTLEQIAKKKESMGICFIGSRNFPNFISEYVLNKPGNFVNIDDGKIVGQHNGIHQWTLGQRTKLTGLPVAYFTAKKDINTNDIYVVQGTGHPALYTESLYTSRPHWIHSCPTELERGKIFKCEFKFQHIENYISCQICLVQQGVVIILETPRRAVTPGQFAVFYKNEECLGSAKILHAGPSHHTLNLFKVTNKSSIYKNKLFNSKIDKSNRITFENDCVSVKVSTS